MPLPPETPVDTTPTAQNASGTVTVSGSPAGTANDGPYRIEKQSLNIHFKRVPHGSGSFNASCISLSGVETSSINYTHYSTGLVCEVEATYSVEKEYAFYNTTAFQQPQKFKYLSLSADIHGNSYGDASTVATVSCLGPMGSIITEKEWYQRKPWVDGLHTEVVSSIDCRTYYASAGYNWGNTSPTSQGYIPRMIDGTAYAGDNFRWFIDPEYELTFQRGGTWDVRLNSSWLYHIRGAYNYLKEDPRSIIDFIDRISQQIRHENLYDRIPRVSYDPSRNPWGDPWVISEAGIAEYRNSRHDYD